MGRKFSSVLFIALTLVAYKIFSEGRSAKSFRNNQLSPTVKMCALDSKCLRNFMDFSYWYFPIIWPLVVQWLSEKILCKLQMVFCVSSVSFCVSLRGDEL